MTAEHTAVDGVVSAGNVSDGSSWESTLGPVLTPDAVITLLSVSRTELDRQRNDNSVLGVRTGNGRWV